MFDVDPRIIVLLLVAVAACLVAWRRTWQASRARAALTAWVRDNRPDVWRTLPRWTLAIAIAIEERLYQGTLHDDAEFVRRYRTLPSRRRVIVPLLVAAICIGAVAIGTKVLEWRW